MMLFGAQCVRLRPLKWLLIGRLKKAPLALYIVLWVIYLKMKKEKPITYKRTFYRVPGETQGLLVILVGVLAV